MYVDGTRMGHKYMPKADHSIRRWNNQYGYVLYVAFIWLTIRASDRRPKNKPINSRIDHFALCSHYPSFLSLYLSLYLSLFLSLSHTCTHGLGFCMRLVRLCLMLFAYSTWCTVYTNTLCIRPAKGASPANKQTIPVPPVNIGECMWMIIIIWNRNRRNTTTKKKKEHELRIYLVGANRTFEINTFDRWRAGCLVVGWLVRWCSHCQSGLPSTTNYRYLHKCVSTLSAYRWIW